MRTIYVGVALLYVTLCFAEDDKTFNSINDLSYKGYVHQAFVKTDTVNYGGNSLKGTTDIRDIGVYGTYTINDNIDVRGFLKYEELGNRLSRNPTFNYLVGDVHKDTSYARYGFRVGKIRNELGFYNGVMATPDLRDQDIDAQGIYRSTLKNFINAGIGSQVYITTDVLPYFNVDIEVAKLKSDMTSPKKDVDSAWFPLSVNGHFENPSARVFHLVASTKDLRWKFRYDRYDVSAPFIRAAGDSVASGSYDVKVELFGVRKYFDTWDVTYEYLKDTTNGTAWNAVRNPAGGVAYAQNLIFRYTPDEKWTYVLGYNMWCGTSKNCDGTLSSAQTGGLVPKHSYYWKDVNVGVKHRFNASWTVKAEYHDQRGSIPVSPIDNPTLPNINGAKNKLFSTSITYSF